MNESCWKGYKQIGMKKKGSRTVPNCVKENKFSFAEWLNENKKQYQGDSNPMDNTWVDTWHEAQKHAFSGNTQLAVSMMKKAAQQAWQESPGEAKYYLGTAAWLSGDKAKCLAMTKDSDVIQTGNDEVLRRLLNSKTSNYQQAYSQNEHVAEWLNESKSKYSGLFQQWDDMDQSMRNELSKSYAEKHGTEFKQELWDANLKQFIDKHQTTPDDVFGDSKRLTQLKEILPKLDYSKFSKRNWEQFWTLAQHADNDEYLQKQALSILARYKQNQHYLNLLWRIANNKGVMDRLYQKSGTAKPTTMDLDQLPSIMQQIAQKLNMTVNELYQYIAQTILS